jgi:WD40 repeat protein
MGGRPTVIFRFSKVQYLRIRICLASESPSRQGRAIVGRVPLLSSLMVIALGADNFATVSNSGRLCIFPTDGSSRQQLVEQDGLASPPTCLGVAGSSAVVGKEDGSLVVWDLPRGVARKLSTDRHASAVTDLALSIDGESLYTASAGKDIFEWRVSSGKLARTLRGDKAGTTCLCAQGSMLAAGRYVDVVVHAL